MFTEGEAARHPPEDEMLPDEREAIADRAAELADEESHLTVEQVAANLGIDLE
jgi:hypothetical protein